MSAVRGYALTNKFLPQLTGTMEAISIYMEAMGPPEVVPNGIQQMWRCSNASGQLFVLWVTDLNDRNSLGYPLGTAYLEVWPPEKGALKAKQKEVSTALIQFDLMLTKFGAKKCA